MAIFYLETSALLKRYRTEEGTQVIQDLIEAKHEGESLITSYFTVLEIVSVTTRLLRARTLTKRLYHRMVGDVERDATESIILQPASDAVLSAAIKQSMTYGLRAPDAIHLATALRVNAAIDEPFYFLCADNKLIEACVDSGLTVINPEAPDSGSLLKKARSVG